MTGEALTHSSLLEADGGSSDSMVNMNLHHAMLRTQGRNRADERLTARVVTPLTASLLASGPADPVVVLTPPHDLVTMTTAHTYSDDVVALL